MTGTRLKEARKEAGLTLEKLAVEAGVSKQSIALIESGKTKGPRSNTLFKIADTLGVEPRWLATGTGPKQRNDRSNINPELLASIAASISSRVRVCIRFSPSPVLSWTNNITNAIIGRSA